jgi:hypothetical protein|tara:strand:- start:1540 stop:1779 length:240 start_codon:yes stop_codon:yes gene_type:complete
MTENEVKEIVSKTVDETLAKMGLNSEEIYEAQKDFMYLREQRKLHEKISLRVRFIIIGFIISGAIALLVLGVKTAIGIK